MISFLLLLHVVSAEVPKTIPLPHIRGKELYDDLCFQCHGVNGLADTPLADSTKAPKLAGEFSDGNYADGIKIVQQGMGLMPAYEMVIDKHDTKRILIYLSGLDAVTGIDPRVKPEIEESTKEANGVNSESEEPSSKEKTNDSKGLPKPKVLPKKPIPEKKP